MHLPAALINSLQNAKGFSKEAFEQEHALSGRITSIRTNPFKWLQSSPPLTTYHLPLPVHPLPVSSPIPWCAAGHYLSARPSFTHDPLFHAGCYYVQEASSMFVEQIIKAVYPDHATTKYKVLDLCAAPGGKTTHLSALFPESLIVANEVIKPRAGILTENMVKWGKGNVVVTSNDAADFKALQGYFDMIVADAPCSGSGMFRKDPDAIEEWSLQNVQLCSKRQQRIIHDSWPALKENGIFIYATCSYSMEEDEAILDWIAEAFEVETIPVPGATGWGVVETVSDQKHMYGYRFYPDKIKGEGFFIACMRKKEAVGEQIPKPKKLIIASKQEQKAIAPFLTDPEQFELVRSNDEIKVLKKCDMEDLALLFSALYIKKLGIKAGRVMRDELIPAHDLALSTIVTLNLEAIDADSETALDYLRKKDIPAGNAARGWNVVRFMGCNLGWIKVLSNRVNNYYPSPFRILKH
ncbi:methyltransferase RsmF C-terminal domain-like protein [Agriterribacter sp.]|uniref:methyltransferase RsmF C-terminal domain-like protein n=1 Tax=Agriterribacter sp. TaxID=2821509 RepID=UPI002B65955A|nr:SAM-dependent methyltransferase [Agriterribacter sp.]HTN07548.1 SAM-dependent methyltransferase [Agriterribacter sp.]